MSKGNESGRNLAGTSDLGAKRDIGPYCLSLEQILTSNLFIFLNNARYNDNKI